MADGFHCLCIDNNGLGFIAQFVVNHRDEKTVIFTTGTFNIRRKHCFTAILLVSTATDEVVATDLSCLEVPFQNILKVEEGIRILSLGEIVLCLYSVNKSRLSPILAWLICGNSQKWSILP